MLTQEQVRENIKSVVEDVISDYKDDPDTDREQVIKRLDEECDTLWGQLVCQGRIDQWTADTLVDNAGECAVIIKTAEEDAWVEDDSGLWEGLTYGVVASIAYFSLRNLLYQAMKDAGYDTNEDFPLATACVADFNREQCVKLLTDVGIECYDSESLEELQEAVRENVKDRTISRDELASVKQ